MNLITQIVEELVNSEISLDSPLFKTKLLAKRLKNDSLLEWVNNELNGYSKGASLPSYRKYNAMIIGNLTTPRHQLKNVAVPVLLLEESFRQSLERFNFDQSVSGLQSLKKGDDTGTLKSPMPLEICALISQNLQEKRQSIEVVTAKKVISSGVIDQILTSVRSNLLDLMMEIENEEDLKIDIIPNRRINEKITYIMNNINNTGDGNVVNTGNNSTVSVKTKIIKNDMNSFRKALKELGVTDNDAAEICTIVIEEEPASNTRLGERANTWISRMLNKSLNGTWDVTAGTAATILAQIIMQYYGVS